MLAIIDQRTPKVIQKHLERRGYPALLLPPHPALPAPVASHPDMLLFFAKDRILCTKEYAEIAKKELKQISEAAKKPICTVEEEVGDRYPRDILLNAAPVGTHLFCLPEHTAKEATEGYTVCPVRQGYAKCATVPVGKDALVTADPSIANAATHAGLDVLLVDAAHIDLPGYDTGFLGGSSAFAPYFDSPEIYFCGNLQSHPNCDEIEDFFMKHQKLPISLSSDPLTDLGTVFLI